MCRALLFHRTVTLPGTPDGALKAARGYRPGDVVVLMPDGHRWGRAEGPPDFLQLDLPGSVDQWRHLLEEHHIPEDTAALAGVDTLQARRRLRFDLAQLPSTVRTQLRTGSAAMTSLPAVQAALVTDRRMARLP